MAKARTKKKTTKKTVEAIEHDESKRPNIPTAEFQSVMAKEDQSPVQVAYERRNRDLDPQLVWRGKDEQDLSDLTVQAPPIFIQEKVHPKALVDDLVRRTQRDDDNDEAAATLFADHFADFDGLDDSELKTEFYQHDANWANRMILGDSLQVMSSLAEKEGMRGNVQCIYIDPPYGIKFNSNFQWSTTSRDVKDGRSEHITREPEMVKAFRDTWRDGIHSYLTYLRDRLEVARDLLNDSGSVFVQIGDENVHRVREVMDEVFGSENYISLISLQKTAARSSLYIQNVSDYVIWYGKDVSHTKFRSLYKDRPLEEQLLKQYPLVYTDSGEHIPSKLHEGDLNIRNLARSVVLTSSHEYSRGKEEISFRGMKFKPGSRYWSTTPENISRLGKASRLVPTKTSLGYLRRLSDYPFIELNNTWSDVATGGGSDRLYVVQTVPKVIQRCILMSSDPGDIVLDPTCGSGTTAIVAEQWGRRWITIDTSRVALALARARLIGAKFPFYLLSDSNDGKKKESQISHLPLAEHGTHNKVSHGFVYEREPHVTMKSIANNTEIDVIWDKYQSSIADMLSKLNAQINETLQEWEIPHKPGENWSLEAKAIHSEWLSIRTARQKEIDASIVAKADFKFLYDKPYEDKTKVRVAGPMTIESLSPHRMLGVDEDDELIDPAKATTRTDQDADFGQMVLENLKTAGVQQSHKEDKIVFSSIKPWPGQGYIAAEGRYTESDSEDAPEKRAAIFIGPEFGTVSKQDLVAAAREAGDADFDVLIACAFNYDALSTEFGKLGRIPILKARMNADLHMAEDLKNTGKGNLFVIFGEPDIDILDAENNKIQVKINGVDVFHPSSGEVRSDNADGIACWFIDTDYNEEAFCVRHAYFLGQNDPYKSLKTTLKAEINKDAWDTLNSDTSRPFKKPGSGRIAVKVINHLGDEVMKVFRVE